MSGSDSEYVEKYGQEMAALRKIVYSLAGVEPEEMGLLPATNRAVERIEELEVDVEEAQTAANSALGAVQAKQRADGGMTKVEVAEKNTRNELVKRAALTGENQQLTANDVQEMCKPEVDVKYQTVKDAWNSLERKWRCFSVGGNEDGLKVCRVKRPAVAEELSELVNDDLGRDDLTKRLISARKGGGG